MTLVKICGIREEEHALVAAGAGASLIGFVFVPVRREVKPDVARSIIQSVRERCEAPPAAIGLFVNESPTTINEIVSEVGLDLVQLHGDEPPDFARDVDVPAIKALRLGADRSSSEVHREIATYLETCVGVLIDSHVPGQWGGTGVVGDWGLATELANSYPICLAGGLSPENVGDAVRRVRPAVVDVSSGVETDGRKDSEKIVAFLESARQAVESGPQNVEGDALVELIHRVRASNQLERSRDIVTGIN